MSESGRFSINEDPGRSSPTASVRTDVRDVVYAAQRDAVGSSWMCRTARDLLHLLEERFDTWWDSSTESSHVVRQLLRRFG